MRAVVYARVSTRRQVEEGLSLGAQTKRAAEYASSLGWTVVQIFREEGVSGKSTEKRLALESMMAELRSGDVQRVIVFKMSRLGRSARDVLNLIHEIQTYGAEVVFLEEGLDTSKPANRLLITLLAGVAEMEAENLAEQVRPGMEESAALGRWQGGRPPFGTMPDDAGFLVLDPIQAETITRMADLILNHHSTQATADILNAEGRRPAKAKAWKSAEVRRTLKSETLKGVLTWSGYDIRCPEILSPDTWEEVQRTLSQTKLTREQNYNYALSGRITCSCGGKLIGAGLRGGRPTYRCENHRDDKRGNCLCDHDESPARPRWWGADALERGVWEQVVLALSRKDQLQEAIDRHLGLTESVEPSQYRALIKREGRLSEAAIQAGVDARLAEDHAERQRLEGIERALAEEWRNAVRELQTLDRLRQDAQKARVQADQWLKVAEDLSLEFPTKPTPEDMRHLFLALDVRVRIRTQAELDDLYRRAYSGEVQPIRRAPAGEKARSPILSGAIAPWQVLDSVVLVDSSSARPFP